MAAKLRCCPAEAQCEKVPRTAEWTTDDQCQSGYGGPLCTSCAAGHVSYSGECIPCEGGSPLWAGFVGLVGFGLVLFVVTDTNADTFYDFTWFRIVGVVGNFSPQFDFLRNDRGG